MNNIERKIENFVLYLWQLPQNILGLLWLLLNVIFLKGISRSSIKIIDGVEIYRIPLNIGNVSLGKYIIVYKNAKYNYTIRHEYGHCKQSMYLGWLYLLIIGLPSIIWACIYKYTNKDYYWFYTEKSADKLANIKR